MKYFSVFCLIVIFAASCLAAVAEPEDISAIADEKKTEKRGIYGFGYGGHGGYGGYYGGHGFGHGYGHGHFGYPSYGYAVHGPSYGHAYYPYHGGYHHGFH